MHIIFLYRLGLICLKSKQYLIFEKLKPILEHPVFGDYWPTENCFPNFGEFTLSFVKINVAYIHVSIASN